MKASLSNVSDTMDNTAGLLLCWFEPVLYCMIDLETFLLGVYRKKYKNNLCYNSFWWIHFLGIQSNAE